MKEVHMERSAPSSPTSGVETKGFGDLTPSALSDEGSEDFFTVASSLLEMQRSERRRLYAREPVDGRGAS